MRSSGQRGRAARRHVVAPPLRVQFCPRIGDHRRVVGAQGKRRRQEPRACRVRDALQAPREWGRWQPPHRPRRSAGPRGPRPCRAPARAASFRPARRRPPPETRRKDRRDPAGSARISRPRSGRGRAAGPSSAPKTTCRSQAGPAAGAAGAARRHRHAASASTAGPPGCGRPSRRATLSNASPGASSMVPPRRVNASGPRTIRNWQCPPETSSIRYG